MGGILYISMKIDTLDVDNQNIDQKKVDDPIYF